MTFTKYRNHRVTVDGIMFDSEKEARRYGELKLLQKAGYVSDLRLQVPFVLIPSQSRDGKVIERKMSYVADFVYKDQDGNQIVEDVKSDGTKTEVYRLKKKLMLFVHGIEVQEY